MADVAGSSPPNALLLMLQHMVSSGAQFVAKDPEPFIAQVRYHLPKHRRT